MKFVHVASSCTVCQDTSHHNSPTMLCPNPPFVWPALMPVATKPCADSSAYAAQMATNVYSIYKDSLKGSFDSTYVGKCLQVASKELLTFADSVSEYHYTLYYYDQAGNLVKTVPPKGVVRNYSATWFSQVSTARQNGTLLTPAHNLLHIDWYNDSQNYCQDVLWCAKWIKFLGTKFNEGCALLE